MTLQVDYQCETKTRWPRCLGAKGRRYPHKILKACTVARDSNLLSFMRCCWIPLANPLHAYQQGDKGPQPFLAGLYCAGACRHFCALNTASRSHLTKSLHHTCGTLSLCECDLRRLQRCLLSKPLLSRGKSLARSNSMAGRRVFGSFHCSNVLELLRQTTGSDGFGVPRPSVSPDFGDLQK